jgi:hypothetical protein
LFDDLGTQKRPEVVHSQSRLVARVHLDAKPDPGVSPLIRVIAVLQGRVTEHRCDVGHESLS